MQAKTQRFGTLDVGRWLAAVAVVLFHCSMFLQHKPFGGVLKAGYHGVDFFFVLSGFVISNAHLKDLGRPQRTLDYIRKRFLRIYPPYWAALALALAWAYWHPFLQPMNVTNVVTNALLIPKNSVDYPFVIPAWTLSYEMLFYIFFGLLIVLPRSVACAALVAWPLAISFFGVPLTTGVFPASFLMSKVILEFFFGVAACLLYVQIGWRIGVLAAGAGVLALMAAAVSESSPNLFPAWAAALSNEMRYGIPSAAIIGGFAAVEARIRPLRSSFTDFLGNVTYSIYLVHDTALIVIVGSGALAWSAPLAPWLTCLVLASIGVAAGVAFHLWVERPVVKLFRHTLRSDSGSLARLDSTTSHASNLETVSSEA